MIECENNEMNIGVIEIGAYINPQNVGWYVKKWGYSYYASSGNFWNGEPKTYGDDHGQGDIIDVWLDLKDKYELSFAKNDKKYGKAADMK